MSILIENIIAIVLGIHASFIAILLMTYISIFIIDRFLDLDLYLYED